MNAGVHDFNPKGNFARLMPVLERELKGAAARDAARQANHRIKRLAFYDFVSSLPNHNLFRTRVNDWLTARTASGKEARGALFYIDIDRFLRINGSFGYEAGNEILRQGDLSQFPPQILPRQHEQAVALRHVFEQAVRLDQIELQRQGCSRRR